MTSTFCLCEKWARLISKILERKESTFVTLFSPDDPPQATSIRAQATPSGSSTGTARPQNGFLNVLILINEIIGKIFYNKKKFFKNYN
jgi:hypothetical protein